MPGGEESGRYSQSAKKRRVGPQVGLDFLSLVLQDGGARGQQPMVVLAGQLDGLLERDLGRPLATAVRQVAKHNGT